MAKLIGKYIYIWIGKRNYILLREKYQSNIMVNKVYSKAKLVHTLVLKFFNVFQHP